MHFSSAPFPLERRCILYTAWHKHVISLRTYFRFGGCSCISRTLLEMKISSNDDQLKSEEIEGKMRIESVRNENLIFRWHSTSNILFTFSLLSSELCVNFVANQQFLVSKKMLKPWKVDNKMMTCYVTIQ